MTKYKFILLIIFSAFIFAMSSCNADSKELTETKETENIPENIVELRDDQIKLANIETGSIEFRSLSGTLKATGMVASAPQNLALVSMPMGGFVKKTTLMPGASVVKGQTLAIIENQQFIEIQQNYLESKNKLEYAEADYNRQRELFKNEVSSAKNMQFITSEYKSLKIQVRALEQKLALIGINPSGLNENNISRSVALVSSISGFVKAVNVSIGKSVSESDILFEIVNTNNLFVELTLFEKDVNKVATGQNIRFFINNETEEHNAVVYQTAQSISDDKTYKVFATVQSKCKNVLPGMFVNAVIEADVHKVMSVPAAAIVSFDETDYIFVFEKNKEEEGKPFTEYRMIPITKGVSSGGYTQITIPEAFDYKTAKVVVKGAYNLLSAKKNAGEMAC